MKKINLAKLENNAKRMHLDLEKAEARIGELLVTGDSRDREIHVQMDGFHHIKNINIDSRWKGDEAKLCNDLKDAFNDALERVDNEIELNMASIIQAYTKETLDDNG